MVLDGFGFGGVEEVEGLFYLDELVGSEGGRLSSLLFRGQLALVC